MPAAAIGEEVWLLRVERFEADSIGLSQWAAYLTDLDDEIAACLHEFIRASVTEIALLRAAATGALLGLTAWPRNNDCGLQRANALVVRAGRRGGFPRAGRREA